MASAEPAESLCFLEAFNAKQNDQITEKEYLNHLLAHFRGVRHSQDNNIDDVLLKTDPFGDSIRRMALGPDHDPILDTTPYEILFTRCLMATLNEVRSDLKRLEQASVPVPLQPLATLAAANGNAAILKYCLARGAKLDAALNTAIELQGNTPAFASLVSKETCGKMAKNESYSPSQLQRWFGDINW